MRFTNYFVQEFACHIYKKYVELILTDSNCNTVVFSLGITKLKSYVLITFETMKSIK